MNVAPSASDDESTEWDIRRKRIRNLAENNRDADALALAEDSSVMGGVWNLSNSDRASLCKTRVALSRKVSDFYSLRRALIEWKTLEPLEPRIPWDTGLLQLSSGQVDLAMSSFRETKIAAARMLSAGGHGLGGAVASAGRLKLAASMAIAELLFHKNRTTQALTEAKQAMAIAAELQVTDPPRNRLKHASILGQGASDRGIPAVLATFGAVAAMRESSPGGSDVSRHLKTLICKDSHGSQTITDNAAALWSLVTAAMGFRGSATSFILNPPPPVSTKKPTPVLRATRGFLVAIADPVNSLSDIITSLVGAATSGIEWSIVKELCEVFGRKIVRPNSRIVKPNRIVTLSEEEVPRQPGVVARRMSNLLMTKRVLIVISAAILLLEHGHSERVQAILDPLIRDTEIGPSIHVCPWWLLVLASSLSVVAAAEDNPCIQRSAPLSERRWNGEFEGVQLAVRRLARLSKGGRRFLDDLLRNGHITQGRQNNTSSFLSSQPGEIRMANTLNDGIMVSIRDALLAYQINSIPQSRGIKKSVTAVTVLPKYRRTDYEAFIWATAEEINKSPTRAPLNHPVIRSLESSSLSFGSESGGSKEWHRNGSVSPGRNQTQAASALDLLNLMVSVEDLGDRTSWRRIGSGGFGTVFRVKLRGSYAAAFKIFNGNKKLSALKEEMVPLLQIRHKNLVELIGWCSDSRHYGVLTELCECDLVAYLGKNRGLPPREMLAIGIDIAEGISYLHDQKSMIHRDIKCANCLLKREGSRNVWKLCDFGLTANSADRGVLRAKGGQHPGSPRYMAPEMYRASSVVDERIDIWAYACCLMQIFGCGDPYAQCSTPNMIENMQKRGISPLENRDAYRVLTDAGFKPRDAKQLDDLLSRCWQFEPTRRPTIRGCLSTLNSIIM